MKITITAKNCILFSIFFFATYVNLYAQEYPGFDIIGRGYNIFDEFANNKSKSQYLIFDLGKMQSKVNVNGNKIPVFISLENISDHKIETIQGSNVHSYVKNYSDKLGFKFDAYIFKGSFASQFSLDEENSSEHLFFTYMDINTKWRINLDTRNFDSLIEYLDIKFKNDLASLNPKRLFEIYGTHFISRAYLGAELIIRLPR